MPALARILLPLLIFLNHALAAVPAEIPGSVDEGFNIGSIDGRVSSILLQADGKILIAGDFSQISGIARRSLARLNPDGLVDTTFHPPPEVPMSNFTYIGALAQQSNGSNRNKAVHIQNPFQAGKGRLGGAHGGDEGDRDDALPLGRLHSEQEQLASFHDLDSNKMVFIPHGMDQMFGLLVPSPALMPKSMFPTGFLTWLNTGSPDRTSDGFHPVNRSMPSLSNSRDWIWRGGPN